MLIMKHQSLQFNDNTFPLLSKEFSALYPVFSDREATFYLEVGTQEHCWKRFETLLGSGDKQHLLLH